MSRRWTTLVTENLWLKALSVGIALVLWIFVRAEEKGEVILRLPIRFLDIPEELVIVGDPVPQVQIVVDGPRTLVSQVDRVVQPYAIDLANSEAGTVEFRIAPDQISLPRGVEISRIMPSVVRVELQRTKRYRLPVQARLTGTLAPGYEVGGVEIEPSTIEIVTARGELDGVETIRTEPISVQDRRSDWNGSIPLDLSGLNVKSITSREVDVFLRVIPKITERRLTGVPVEVRGPGGPYGARPRTVDLRIMGPEGLLRNLSPASLVATVDLPGALNRTSPQPLRVRLPDQVVLLEVLPARVEVSPAR